MDFDGGPKLMLPDQYVSSFFGIKVTGSLLTRAFSCVYHTILATSPWGLRTVLMK